MEGLNALKRCIAEAKHIAFLGGAGVSTESGIPDFRSESGRFEAIREFGEEPETLLSRAFFLRYPERFFAYYKKALLVTDAGPNPAHKALCELEKIGKLTAVITQNIDGLHQKAGSKNVLELHGSIYRNTCMGCGKSYGIEKILEDEVVPRCACGGIVKPDVVLYGEGLDTAVLNAAVRHIMEADMLLVGGTSLAVYPAAGLIDNFRGERLVLINKSATPYDGAASLVIRAPIGETLRAALARPEEGAI
ncbi:MAG: NAD-dependent protein deacylase [Clostridiaceae bacterium]|nr:NAD-dependent protein deacylase [Eubacteriales bacterium]